MFQFTFQIPHFLKVVYMSFFKLKLIYVHERSYRYLELLAIKTKNQVNTSNDFSRFLDFEFCSLDTWACVNVQGNLSMTKIWRYKISLKYQRLR